MYFSNGSKFQTLCASIHTKCHVNMIKTTDMVQQIQLFEG